jgi:hypothetical protein
MTEATKRCSRCKEELPLSAFNRFNQTTYTLNGAINHRPGVQHYCRACISAWHREHAQRLRQERLHAQARRNP